MESITPTAIIVHHVQDGHVWANAWKQGPGSRHEMFGTIGVKCRNFRDPNDPNATGVMAEIPDDEVRCAGDHVVYAWTFTGTHAGTKNPLRVAGWEEWDLDPDLQVVASRGWFDAADYERQTTAR